MEAADPAVSAAPWHCSKFPASRRCEREQLFDWLRRKDQSWKSHPHAGPHSRSGPRPVDAGGMRSPASPLSSLQTGVWAAEGHREEAEVGFHLQSSVVWLVKTNEKCFRSGISKMILKYKDFLFAVFFL